jgi:hypothetical protein
VLVSQKVTGYFEMRVSHVHDQNQEEEVDSYHVLVPSCPYETFGTNHFSLWNIVLINIIKNSETFKLQLET